MAGTGYLYQTKHHHDMQTSKTGKSSSTRGSANTHIATSRCMMHSHKKLLCVACLRASASCSVLEVDVLPAITPSKPPILWAVAMPMNSRDDVWL
jgi:hypothetical protein